MTLISTSLYVAEASETPPPTGARTIHFFTVASGPAYEPFAIEVRPTNGDRWYGLFTRVDPQARPDMLFESGDEGMFVVVASLAGYIVNAVDPDEWLALPFPIAGALFVPECNLTIMWDFNSLFAYRGLTPRWSAEDVASDGFRGIRLRDGKLTGEAWSAPRNSWIPFELDAASGSRSASRTYE